tara:strand:- start:797 stop:994 length:198 start_codon:yes stop_codon:yes gene_type:complete
MSDITSKERFIENTPEYVQPLELYPNREIFCVEKLKICCCIIMMIIGAGFLITASTRGCIYNCKN